MLFRQNANLKLVSLAAVIWVSRNALCVVVGGGGGTLGISGWGCAAGTLEPLTYTRASSAEFRYPILE